MITVNTQAREIKKPQFNQDLYTLVQLDSLYRDYQNQNEVLTYINNKYASNPFEKEMFTEAAEKIYQILNTDLKNKKEHIKLDKELLNIYTCRDYIVYKFSKEKDISKKIQEKEIFKSIIFKSKENQKKYIEHKKLLPFEFNDLTEKALKREKAICIKKYKEYSNLD